MGKVIKKVFGGGSNDAANRAAEEQARLAREQQERDRIERENKLMLEGSTGADTAESSGNVQAGYYEANGGGVRRKKRTGTNISASLGIG